MLTRQRPQVLRRRLRHRLVTGMAVTALAVLVLPPVAASATEGSVPLDVERYAADDDGLVHRLNDIFGIGADGSGIDFNETTAFGDLCRVFVFTAEYLAGEATELPVRLVNEWVTPITIDERPVGLATIWINPGTDRTELADFRRGRQLAASFTELPEAAALVHDIERDAWFLLEESKLTVLEPGSSGLSGSTTLSVYQRYLATRTDAAAPPAAPPNDGILIGGIILGAALLAIVVVLLLPLGRKRDLDVVP